jgi:hypothetical protein
MSSAKEMESVFSADDLTTPSVILPIEEDKLQQGDLRQENPLNFKEYHSVSLSDVLSASSEKGRTQWDDREEDASDEISETSSSHRVFVKPEREETPAPRRPLLINPDTDYRAFSEYTRRRKRKRHSLLRRVIGICVLLFAVGSAAWFLLGLRKVQGPIPITPAPESILSESVVPVHEPSPLPVDVISQLQIDPPARGVIVGTNVNIRPDHSTNGAPVMKLNADTRADILDRWEGTSGSLSGPWFRIRTNRGEGWIYGQYFQPLDGRGTTLPEGYTAALLKTFGAGKTELIGQLGQPTRQTATALTWTGATANLRGDNGITRLQLTSAKYVLQNGIAVGFTDEALYRNVGYPSEYRSGQLRYLESGTQGMVVRMQNGKVQSITVGNI